MRITICPHATLAAVAAEAAFRRIVLLASPGSEAPALALDAPVHRASFHDIAEERPGLDPPTPAQVSAILAFADVGPVLVSCQMGVSRSTAIAFALACRAAPDCPEAEIAAALRRAVPIATPNPLVVAQADRLLGRNGSMVAAVLELGLGADWAPYRSATLDPAPVPA